ESPHGAGLSLAPACLNPSHKPSARRRPAFLLTPILGRPSLVLPRAQGAAADAAAVSALRVRRPPMKRSAWIVVALLLTTPTLGLAQRTSVSGDFPIYANGGLPDLTVDPKRFVSQMEIVDRLFEAGSCELEEGTVGGTGYRRILRFDTVLMNSGDGDLKVGSPTDPSNPYASWFVYASCHRHYHI